jgi:hypothetical protein
MKEFYALLEGMELIHDFILVRPQVVKVRHGPRAARMDLETLAEPLCNRPKSANPLGRKKMAYAFLLLFFQR